MYKQITRFFKAWAAQASGPSVMDPAAWKARTLPKGKHCAAADDLGSKNDSKAGQSSSAEIILLAEKAVEKNNHEQGAQLFAKALAIEPANPIIHYKQGNFLKDQGQLESALCSYDQAISLDANYANAFCNRGVVLQRLRRSQEALADYKRAAALHPQDALAHCNMGLLLQAMKCQEDALACFSRAIEIYPGFVGAFCNRGVLHQELGNYAKASDDYGRAININPDFAHSYFCRGTLRHAKKELEAALSDYNQVIQMEPEHADAHCNRGTVLVELRQYDAAIVSFNAAININPKFAEAHSNLADIFFHLRQFGVAIASYDRAIALKPSIEFATGMRRHAKMYLCDWMDLEADINLIAAGVEAGAAMAPPLIIANLFDSPKLDLLAAQHWVRRKYGVKHLLPAIPWHGKSNKIHLGYFSGDFCDHPVSMLAVRFLELHDRSKYHVTGFSYAPSIIDAMRKRLEEAFDDFHELRGKSDEEVARLSRSLGIDIAIDLAGHTGTSRTGIFALQAAPIQVNYLGYPGTMAAEYMDYLIADRTVVPEMHQQYYSEKIIYLPGSFLPHDSSRLIARRQFTREELGLPKVGAVFCGFNSNHKILPDIFNIWMRILARVDRSVLWLSQADTTAVQNLRREAESRGIDTGRLVFADRMASAADHLARYRAADLFLDTLPYNAHATALDALWSGLPLLTRMGEGFAGRVAASLLKSVGLPELVTSTASEYEDLAVALALDPERLARIKLKLAQNRLTTPLFDTARFTKNLEKAYEQIYQRYQEHLLPEHIYVDELTS